MMSSLDVIRWVQDHGGIEKVKEAFECAQQIRKWEERSVELYRLLKESGGVDGLKARLMPEGMEWPKDRDGVPIVPGETRFGQSDGREWRIDAVGKNAAWANIGYKAWKRGEDPVRLRPYWLSKQRPAPKVLDADGAEIRVGDAVYDKSGTVCEVVKVYPDTCEVAVRWCRPDGDWRYAVINARTLTHERPDSWERLEEDAGKSVEEYWGCSDFDCTSCPAMVGGKRPREKYDVGSCGYAVSLDLVRRAKALAGVK